jgi:O-antigen ligase
VKLWAAWISWLFLATLFSHEPLRGLSAVSYSITAVLFLVSLRSNLNAETRRLWFPITAGAALILCAAAFLISTPSRPMVGLLFPYYNYTTAFSAAVFSAVIGAWCHSRWPGRSKYLFAAIAVLCLLEILIAKSRGALFAACAGTAFALWSSGRKRIVVYTCAAILAAIVLAPSPWISTRFKLDHLGAHARPAIWNAAIDVANESPFTGEGPGQFDRGFLRHQFPTPEGHRPTAYGLYTRHAHSEFLQQAAETGWPGLSLFLLALWALWKKRAKDRDAAAASAAAATMFVTGFFENIFALPAFFWFFLSALVIAAPLPSGTPRPTRKLRPLLIFGLLLALFSWWPARETSRRRSAAFEAQGTQSLQYMLGALTLSPEDGDLWSDLAYLYAREGGNQQALRAMLQAERLQPTNAVYILRTAEILKRMKNWEAVRDKALHALSLEPICPPAHLLMAEALLNLGDRRSAVRELDNASRTYSPEHFDPGYDRSIRTMDPRVYAQLRLALNKKK